MKNKYIKWLKTSRTACLIVLPVAYILSAILYFLVSLFFDIDIYDKGKHQIWGGCIWVIISTFSLFHWFRFISDKGYRGEVRGFAYFLYSTSIVTMMFTTNSIANKLKSTECKVNQITAEAIGNYDFIYSATSPKFDTSKYGVDYSIEQEHAQRKGEKSTFRCIAYITVPIVNSNGVYYGFTYGEREYIDDGTIDYETATKNLSYEINEQTVIDHIKKNTHQFHQVPQNIDTEYVNWMAACQKSSPQLSKPKVILDSKTIDYGPKNAINGNPIFISLILLAVVLLIQRYYCYREEE